MSNKQLTASQNNLIKNMSDLPSSISVWEASGWIVRVADDEQ